MGIEFEGNKPVTVGMMIRALQSFDPEAEVIIEHTGTEYQSPVRINPPIGDEDQAQRAVCIVAGGPYL